MKYNLIVTEVAELHILDACMYYEEQLPGLSEWFLSELEDACIKVAEHPQYYSFISSQNEGYCLSNDAEKKKKNKLDGVLYFVIIITKVSICSYLPNL